MVVDGSKKKSTEAEVIERQISYIIHPNVQIMYDEFYSMNRGDEEKKLAICSDCYCSKY